MFQYLLCSSSREEQLLSVTSQLLILWPVDLSTWQANRWTVQLFPVSPADGKTLDATGDRCAGSHRIAQVHPLYERISTGWSQGAYDSQWTWMPALFTQGIRPCPSSPPRLLSQVIVHFLIQCNIHEIAIQIDCTKTINCNKFFKIIGWSGRTT